MIGQLYKNQNFQGCLSFKGIFVVIVFLVAKCSSLDLVCDMSRSHRRSLLQVPPPLGSVDMLILQLGNQVFNTLKSSHERYHCDRDASLSVILGTSELMSQRNNAQLRHLDSAKLVFTEKGTIETFFVMDVIHNFTNYLVEVNSTFQGGSMELVITSVCVELRQTDVGSETSHDCNQAGTCETEAALQSLNDLFGYDPSTVDEQLNQLAQDIATCSVSDTVICRSDCEKQASSIAQQKSVSVGDVLEQALDVTSYLLPDYGNGDLSPESNSSVTKSKVDQMSLLVSDTPTGVNENTGENGTQSISEGQKGVSPYFENKLG
eukprot:TRINITY_DN2476_c0_g2_i1.p1 TRINITY_DN2476_c0_g2~~TRINITY_DN2476_c0_g2_i1.p1  ORF type:complete len:320 (+),score=24.27 TRINITY_DN2476_c0_g2_i1:384-1343(+)